MADECKAATPVLALPPPAASSGRAGSTTRTARTLSGGVFGDAADGSTVFGDARSMPALPALTLPPDSLLKSDLQLFIPFVIDCLLTLAAAGQVLLAVSGLAMFDVDTAAVPVDGTPNVIRLDTFMPPMPPPEMHAAISRLCLALQAPLQAVVAVRDTHAPPAITFSICGSNVHINVGRLAIARVRVRSRPFKVVPRATRLHSGVTVIVNALPIQAMLADNAARRASSATDPLSGLPEARQARLVYNRFILNALSGNFGNLREWRESLVIKSDSMALRQCVDRLSTMAADPAAAREGRSDTLKAHVSELTTALATALATAGAEAARLATALAASDAEAAQQRRRVQNATALAGAAHKTVADAVAQKMTAEAQARLANAATSKARSAFSGGRIMIHHQFFLMHSMKIDDLKRREKKTKFIFIKSLLVKTISSYGG